MTQLRVVAAERNRKGNRPDPASSILKIKGSEIQQATTELLMEVVGEPAFLSEGSPGAVLASRLESMYRGVVILTFGGGVNEVQRDLISVFGLGMPMAKR